MKRYVDVIVVIPLEEEFQVVLEIFGYSEELHSDTQIRFASDMPNSKATVLLVKQNKMGKTSTQEALVNCLDNFDAALLVCVGIAGGISSDLKIGDVCYTGTLIDVLDNAKASSTSDSVQEIALSPTFYDSPQDLSILIGLDRLSHSTKASHEDWAKKQHEIAQQLIPGEFSGRNGKKEKIEKPHVFEGAIACGFVSSSPEFNRKLREIDRKLLALETESGGLFAVGKQKKLPALTIRGISDYASGDKTQFEFDTNNKSRIVAINNAASFLFHQLNTTRLATYFTKLRTKRADEEATLPLFAPPTQDPIAEALIEQSEILQDKLRNVAPGYSLQAKGYRLPVPRIKTLRARAGMPQLSQSHPIEVREALRDTRILTLYVPREYPDLSVSWILASDLISAQILEKKVVPCVIEASSLQRPRFGIKELIDTSLLNISHLPDIQLVFIIDNFHFESKTRIDFLREQIEIWPDAKFLIVTHSRMNPLLEGELTSKLASTTAQVCDVSFREISFFLQKNFELSAPASEVIAVRLQETFNKYALPAHPSYFAGIPRDTLNALLQANRRAELIQLAVAGYLSFVVADDLEPVSLSRTTREKFLTELAFSIKFEGKSFNEAELVSFTGAIAEKYDYNISPVKFISAFMDKGILHFENGLAQFTLPFMESYLLAKILIDQPSDAARYFAVNSDGFDMRTFTIYAEIGAYGPIVEAILGALDTRIAELSSDGISDWILFDPKVSSTLLIHLDRLKAIQDRLLKAEEDVRNDHDSSHEKQRLLDATDRIREKASVQVLTTSSNGKNDKSDVYGVESAAWSIWDISITLLGSGSERLEATTKRELINKIVKLSGLLIDRMTRDVYKFDFDKLKQDASIQSTIISMVKKSDTPPDIAAAREIANALIDLLEYVLLLHPFISVMMNLCEEARDNVLAQSILNTAADDDLEELIRVLWLSDIDVPKGRQGLIKSIKNLPKSRLLRNAISVHLMSRVYWKHWKKEDRLSLLNAANESLKGVGVTYKTGQLQRIIEKLPDA